MYSIYYPYTHKTHKISIHATLNLYLSFSLRTIDPNTLLKEAQGGPHAVPLQTQTQIQIVNSYHSYRTLNLFATFHSMCS